MSLLWRVEEQHTRGKPKAVSGMVTLDSIIALSDICGAKRKAGHADTSNLILIKHKRYLKLMKSNTPKDLQPLLCLLHVCKKLNLWMMLMKKLSEKQGIPFTVLVDFYNF